MDSHQQALEVRFFAAQSSASALGVTARRLLRAGESLAHPIEMPLFGFREPRAMARTLLPAQ